jgi:hypothetical protein
MCCGRSALKLSLLAAVAGFSTRQASRVCRVIQGRVKILSVVTQQPDLPRRVGRGPGWVRGAERH